MIKKRWAWIFVLLAGMALGPGKQVNAEQVLANPEDTLGRPVAYVLLSESESSDGQFEDLKKADAKQKRSLVAYKGLAMLDRNTEHPILVFQGFNTKLNQAVKVYLNWNRVVGIQIIDPNVAF
jgi:hypothetical protein